MSGMWKYISQNMDHGKKLRSVKEKVSCRVWSGWGSRSLCDTDRSLHNHTIILQPSDTHTHTPLKHKHELITCTHIYTYKPRHARTHTPTHIEVFSNSSLTLTHSLAFCLSRTHTRHTALLSTLAQLDWIRGLLFSAKLLSHLPFTR